MYFVTLLLPWLLHTLLWFRIGGWNFSAFSSLFVCPSALYPSSFSAFFFLSHPLMCPSTHPLIHALMFLPIVALSTSIFRLLPFSLVLLLLLPPLPFIPRFFPLPRDHFASWHPPRPSHCSLTSVHTSSLLLLARGLLVLNRAGCHGGVMTTRCHKAELSW